MASSSNNQFAVYDDGFDWEAAVIAIDVACEATAAEKSVPSVSSFDGNPKNCLGPFQQVQKKGNFDVRFNSVSSAKQSTLDKFIGTSYGNPMKPLGKSEFSNGLCRNNSYGDDIVDKNGGGVPEFVDMEIHDGFVKIDREAAKTWIYPVNVPRRDYQYSIARTALFSNTLVVLPTGLGKTLIAAVVMYNFFRWFPEGKIVFAAPSRPLVLQQIEACHNIVGIPQEWTIDLTGQINPSKRGALWRDRRVFFVTPQVLEKDIHTGSCIVKHLVCLVIDEAHHATKNHSYCVSVRELMDDPAVQLRILALSATPGSKQQTIQDVINNLHITTIECRNETDPEVLPYVQDRKIELIQVPMGDEADVISNLLLEVVSPYVSRLNSFGLLPKRDFHTYSPPDFLNSRDRFRREPPQGLPHTKYGEIEGYYGVLIALYHVWKLLSSHGIKLAFDMLDEKFQQGNFARLMGRNETLLKAKLLMQQNFSHGVHSPKLDKMLEVLVDHFKVKDPRTSKVIIFSSYRNSVSGILNALANIGEHVKAMEFIGQSSGKTSKGQSQKVQQAVLQKFRTGGYNIIVATSIGEEGLDILEVDLVICFDANISPLRMIQRMGRTGRKHDGRVVLACKGPELKGYTNKQARGKAIKKHMINGGTNSFNFHPSPRMVPHVFKPEVQFREMTIEEFVPRGKKVKDCNNHVLEPTYKNELTNAESDLLAKYFPSNEAWRPSLIAFPHFQASPSCVNKVAHSSRTVMLIDAMQALEGLSPFSEENKALSVEGEDIMDPFVRVETLEPNDKMMIEDSGRSTDPAEEKCEKGMETSMEVDVTVKDIQVEDIHKQKSFLHIPLFGSTFVSVDDFGNVLVSSLPQLPLKSNSKINEDREDIAVQYNANTSSCSRLPEEVLFVPSSPCHLDEKNRKFFPGDEEIVLQSPLHSRMPKESDVSCVDHTVMHDGQLKIADESSHDFMDFELSPRLTNFIESGVVPESPVNNYGTGQHEEPFQDCSLGKMVVPCQSDNDHDHEMQPPVLNLGANAPSTCASPIPVVKERQSPLTKLSNTSGSEDWLVDCGPKPETVEQVCKFRRLRKLRDLDRNVPSESKEQTCPSRKHKAPKGTGNDSPSEFLRGKKKRVIQDAAVYIEEEAEASLEDVASDNEEDENVHSSYEDSFIDDGVNPTSVSTQAGCGRVDMMAIYRRSLLSQSPYQRLPTNFSPGSVVQSSKIDEGGTSSGSKHEITPQSMARISPLTIDGDESALLDSRRRNLKSVPMVNLDKEFSAISETAGENGIAQVQQVEKAEANVDMFDDDSFFEGIDLDAVEEEATRLLKQKAECSTVKVATLPDYVRQNLCVMDSPSFDLGI